MAEEANQSSNSQPKPSLLQAMRALPDTATEPDFDPPLMEAMLVVTDFSDEKSSPADLGVEHQHR